MQMKGAPWDLPKSPEDFVDGKSADYVKVLENHNVWAKIPLLNYTPLHQLKDNELVRFRGMIQDMQDPEFYLEKYEVQKTDGTGKRMQQGKYRDCLVMGSGEEVNFDADTNVQGERRVLFVVSIPGLNEWTKTYEESCNSLNVPDIEAAAGESNCKKRSAPEDEEMDTDMQEEMTSVNNAATEMNKRVRTENSLSSNGASSSNQGTLAAEYMLNSPIPERPSKACLVKVYADFDSYKLNTVIDVVGFLSVDPTLDASTMEVDGDNASELQAMNPPPSLIPRLHAIAVHQLPHANPMLDARFLPVQEEELSMLSVQKELRMLLTLCLFNDDMAADYLLSHLISSVYKRCELETIGKFSLNLCNLPRDCLTEYTKELYEILEQLLPASHYLPMTLETMNTAAFAPKKDYETNKLVSGLLQLAPHTHLILDETHMQQGNLQANGVQGIQSIANVINYQQIKCNFQYYSIDYDVDTPVMVLSEGRSMLPNDILLPLKTDTESVALIAETMKAAKHYMNQNSRLDQFRRYLTQAKISPFTMNPEDSDMIQNDFVEMRKAKSVSHIDDLHSLLVLSRLLAKARGKDTLDKESWELAKEMEQNRHKRIADLPKSNLKLRN